MTITQKYNELVLNIRAMHTIASSELEKLEESEEMLEEEEGDTLAHLEGIINATGNLLKDIDNQENGESNRFSLQA